MDGTQEPISEEDFRCATNKAENKLADKPYITDKYRCTGFCGGVAVGYGWSFVEVTANCKDSAGKEVRVEVEEDFDGRYSAFCAKFAGARGKSCEVQAKFVCRDETSKQDQLHTDKKTYTISDASKDCSCICVLSDTLEEVSEEDVGKPGKSCGTEWTWISKSACEKQSLDNCEAAPKARRWTTCSEDGNSVESCTKQQGFDYTCKANASAGKCQIVSVESEKTCEVRKAFFHNTCGNYKAAQCPINSSLGCGLFVEGADGELVVFWEALMDGLLLWAGKETSGSMTRCSVSAKSSK